MVLKILPVDGAALSVYLCGRGDAVVLIPSLARGALDFSDLMTVLADAGFLGIAVNPRGVDGSSGELTGISAHDLAGDVAGIIEALGVAPAHIVGHGYGNRIARCLAQDRPALVRTVTLLAAGGLVPAQRRELEALKRLVSDELSDTDWLSAARISGLFAPTSDPMVWRGGWWPSVAAGQLAAIRATPREEWWAAGSAPILVIQGLDDKLAVPANGRMLRDALGDRVELIEVPQAGHALLPEKPGAVARAMLAFLKAHGS